MSKNHLFEKYYQDQRDAQTAEKEAKVVKQYCDRNREAFQPLVSQQIKYEQENYKSYKSNSLILRMDFDDGRFVQYADNLNSNSKFEYNNRCIIAVPGIPGSVKEFAPIEKRLEPNFCRFIHLFFPGFDSIDERRGTYQGTLQDGVKLMNDFFDRLGIKKVILLMHSLGGYFSKFYAYSCPERVESMIQLASIPLTEWNGWSFMRQFYESQYNLGEESSLELINSDEARQRVTEGQKEFKSTLTHLTKKQQKEMFGPVVLFSTCDLICMRKITRSLPGGIGEILSRFRQIESKIPKLIVYSPKDIAVAKNLYEEEIYNVLFINNKVNYTLEEQPFKDLKLDLTNFQSNFVFRLDEADHYLNVKKANELSVIIKSFIQCLNHIKISPVNNSRL